MPFEFAFLDWLQQFHNPVLDALAVFLNYAGEHGEIWIAFTLLLLLFRRTRKAGCAMATALVLYLVAGDCILKPLFARPRPCDVNTAITILVKRPHGHSFPSGHTASAFAAAFALWLQNRKLGVPALVLAAFIAFTRLYLYVHFPTDVLGGLVLGLALGFFASWLVDSLANKSKKKQSVYCKTPSAGAERLQWKVFLFALSATLYGTGPPQNFPVRAEKRRTAASFSCVMQRLFFCRWDLAFLPVAGAYFLASARLPSA